MYGGRFSQAFTIETINAKMNSMILQHIQIWVSYYGIYCLFKWKKKKKQTKEKKPKKKNKINKHE